MTIWYGVPCTMILVTHLLYTLWTFNWTLLQALHTCIVYRIGRPYSYHACLMLYIYYLMLFYSCRVIHQWRPSKNWLLVSFNPRPTSSVWKTHTPPCSCVLIVSRRNITTYFAIRPTVDWWSWRWGGGVFRVRNATQKYVFKIFKGGRPV